MEESSILDKVLSSKQSTDIQNFNPQEVLSTLMKHLSSKEEEILRRRFGLNAQRRETLEEIGKRFAVTRERIRQIEDGAIKKIREQKKFQESTKTTEEVLRHILELHGGAMTEESLMRELFRDEDPPESDRRVVVFLLHELFSDKFDRIGKSEQLRPGWKLKVVPQSSLDELREQLTNTLERVGHPLNIEKLMEIVRQETYFLHHPEKLSEDVLTAMLELSPSIAHNPFQEWGLTQWGAVVPKRMNDKIYLILKKQGKPMHFTEITKRINEIGFDHRRAYPPTVHNELILNKQYVLVGRGIYALGEWGYKPGVVADVLQDILQDAGTPLTRDELVHRVLEQRIVKKNTIHLALADRARFHRLADGKYELIPTTLKPEPSSNS